MKHKASVRGSALIYILIAIALLGILTATFMDSSSQQTTSQNSYNIVSQLGSQIAFIRASVQECVLNYPAGDTTMPANPVGGQNPVRPYPLAPNNSYLASPSSGTLVKDIRCPGNPGNSNNHLKIFAGSSGKFLPPPVKLFNDWTYYNSTDGVFFMGVTTKTDTYLDGALKKLDSQYSTCEMQYIDASSGNVNVDAAATTTCASGTKCVVIRMITTASTLYPGETGCP